MNFLNLKIKKQKELFSPSIFGNPISTAPDFASVLVPSMSWFHFKTIKIMPGIIFHFGGKTEPLMPNAWSPHS